MAEPYVTSREAARRLGVGLSTLQGWAARGIVRPAWRTPGGQARWDVADLRRQLGMPPHTGDEPSAGPDTPVHQPVAAAIVTSKLGVLVERRLDGRPLWTFPCGEVESGESPADAAVRECKEECGLAVKVSHTIGERNPHPQTGRHMIYLAARPYQGTDVHNGDEAELAEVRWASLAEAEQLMPGMFPPARDHLARTLTGRRPAEASRR
jgi:8-oxo-dGTP diphosphatase